jgi:hypothetical protein
MTLTGEQRSTWIEIYPSVILFTASDIDSVLGANPGIRSEKPAIKHLSYGTVIYLRSRV